MTWGPLANQFCIELAFGVLVALAFVRGAPLGFFFFRLMSTTAVVPVLVALGLSVYTGAAQWTDPWVLAGVPCVLAWPVLAGPFRGAVWWSALVAAVLSTCASLVLVLHDTAAAGDMQELVLMSLSAMATGAVAGTVGLAMVLGHWYLTVPKLKVSHLARLNKVTVGAMVVSLLLVAVTCLVFREDLNAARTPLLGPWGLFYLGSRLAVGLLLPLLFAWMTAGSLKFQNTRSATGILYASTILVLIGTAISITLQDTYGVPL